MGEKKPETASQMLESLNEFLLGEEPDFKDMSTGEIAAYLKKNKLDSGRVFKAARSALNEAQGEVKLAKAREKRLSLQSNLPTTRKPLGQRAALLEQIRQLAGAEAATVYARKFEDSPDEDLRSLLEDFELLKQLDLDDDEE